MILEDLQKILKDNGHKVSEIEYTAGNYDRNGKLIDERIPTLTTKFCEIGTHGGESYFVFVIETSSFTEGLFNILTNIPSVSMYPFKDFKRTLYPSTRIDYAKIIKIISKEVYLQIQLDFKNTTAKGLYKSYLQMVSILNENHVRVINQIEVDLKKKKS